MKFVHLPLLFILVSCHPESEKKRVSRSFYDLGKLVNKQLGNCDSVSNTGAYLNLKYWEPSGTTRPSSAIRSELTRKFIKIINTYNSPKLLKSHPEAQNDVGKAFELFADDYKKLRKELPDYSQCWGITITGDTLMVTSRLMTYQLEEVAFTGAAHPQSLMTYHIFDLKSGVEKDKKELITDSVALLKKAEMAFRKAEKLDNNADLKKKGYFLRNGKFFLPDDYTFTREGIIFYYNKYEITAYAFGPNYFTIPYQELNGIVKTELIF